MLAKVIVASKDKSLAAAIESGGHRVYRVAGCAKLRELLRTTGSDMVFIDLNMKDSEKAVRLVRKYAPKTPLIGVNANGANSDVDSISTSSPHSLLRRVQWFAPAWDDNAIYVDGIMLSVSRGQLVYQGKRYHLTRKMTKLLELLMRYPNEVVSRHALYKHAWGRDWRGADTGTLDVHIGWLRKIIGHKHIETVKCIGYQFVTSCGA